MASRLRTRINENGYSEFWDSKTQAWVPTHRRAAENKLGDLRPGFHVHHRDGNKSNNQHSNLLEAHPKVHGRLHAHPDACVRCGRDRHWSSSCRAKTFWDGTPIVE
jgi:hypothetical protein